MLLKCYQFNLKFGKTYDTSRTFKHFKFKSLEIEKDFQKTRNWEGRIINNKY